ncbi:hypothetical protein [Pseudomonas sp. B5(2017)]|uniref:hypothetical protein n=1 Tax=Pseudomonas sp. B5(2017) TaxID=1981714 RepID=UPI00111BF5A0|nr:hypothetical protein [Pseudomonas sp. B5(2017)]
MTTHVPNHPKNSSTVGKETCMDLFRVQANIPFNHAFSGSAARILSGFAKALIDDIELGLNKASVQL